MEAQIRRASGCGEVCSGHVIFCQRSGRPIWIQPAFQEKVRSVQEQRSNACNQTANANLPGHESPNAGSQGVPEQDQAFAQACLGTANDAVDERTEGVRHMTKVPCKPTSAKR